MGTRVLALTRYGRLGASSRLRFLQYIPFLEAEGVEVSIAPLLPDAYLKRYYGGRPTDWAGLAVAYLRRLSVLLNVRSFDLIWIEKELFPNLPAWAEMVLRCLGIPYVVDYDDAIFHNYDLSRNPLKRLMGRKIDRVMRGATLVVCGNAYLTARAQQAGARQVETIPTVVDLQRYAVSGHVLSEAIVIGWIGSSATVKYLEGIAPALRRLAADFPVRLRVIGARFSAPGLEVECRAWSEEHEVVEIQGFDIGIMPLLDSPWERGKCGYKLIQYMACGLPCVASPVGVNAEIIKKGVNGYLAGDTDAWFAALRSLCADAGARQAMGAEGRRMVEQRYCLQVAAPRLAALLAKAATGGDH